MVAELITLREDVAVPPLNAIPSGAVYLLSCAAQYLCLTFTLEFAEMSRLCAHETQ